MLILKEEEISLTSIAEHLENAGIDTDSSKSDRLTLHSDQGLGFHLFMDDRKFIRLRTYLPIREGHLTAMDFSNELNQSVFFRFSIQPVTNGNRDSQNKRCRLAHRIGPVTLRAVCSMWWWLFQ